VTEIVADSRSRVLPGNGRVVRFARASRAMKSAALGIYSIVQ